MKKFFVVLYSVIAYLLFVFTIFYAVGFVGNMVVPKSIDSGSALPFWPALLVNMLLLAIFSVQHSVMARPAFKKWWTGMVPPAMERSTYVLLSSVALLLLFWGWQPMPFVLWHADNKMVALALMGVYFLGWLVALLSTFMINHFELFGLTALCENWRKKQVADTSFKTVFFYKIVRHPIMLGYLIAFWAAAVMTVGHLLFSVVMTVYILVAVRYFEEKDLLQELGKDYEEYKKKVPMIIPFVGKGD